MVRSSSEEKPNGIAGLGLFGPFGRRFALPFNLAVVQSVQLILPASDLLKSS